MATLAAPDIRLADRAEPRFYLGYALTCLVVAIVGFAPTYWIPLLSGRLDAPGVIHLHAIAFNAWLLLFVTQAWFATTGRFDRHRRLGLGGVALATAMLFIGLDVAATRLAMQVAAGSAEAARAFAAVPFTGIVFFALLMAVAFANVVRPEIHKRVILVANAGILQAAAGRVVRMLIPAGGPGAVEGAELVARSLVPAAMVDLLVVAAMVHDRRTRGSVHPVYWIAGAALVFVQVVRVPLSTSEVWLALTRWLVG